MMPMAAGPGPEPGDRSAAYSVLTGRAWLAALPNELAAQRRVMATGNLPPGIESTVVGLDAPGLRRAARASAKVLTTASEAAASRHPADLPVAMAAYVTSTLSR